MNRKDKMEIKAVTNPRTTTTPFKYWTRRARIIERLYRLTHNGQIRTLVIRDYWKESKP
jgi:hypothetical protein